MAAPLWIVINCPNITALSVDILTAILDDQSFVRLVDTLAGEVEDSAVLLSLVVGLYALDACGGLVVLDTGERDGLAKVSTAQCDLSHTACLTLGECLRSGSDNDEAILKRRLVNLEAVIHSSAVTSQSDNIV